MSFFRVKPYGLFGSLLYRAVQIFIVVAIVCILLVFL